MKRIKSLVVLGVVGATSLLGVTNPLARADGEAPRIMLVLDASGSMKDADPSGGSKMDAAKAALTKSLDSMPAGAEVGLRVYGAGTDGNGADGACTDSQNVHPVGPLDKAGLTSQIQSFQPRGDTPIAYALAEAAKDLGDKGKRHIILVSDGEETCDPDPCATVKKLSEQGVDIQIDAVGFAVDDKARQQLTCMAEAGGGSYYDAADAPALNSTLALLGARTARPFTVSGAPVEGTDVPAGAPELTAGQYTDTTTASASAATKRYYKIKRQLPDSSLRVSVVARRPGKPKPSSEGSWHFALRLPGEAGSTCASGGESNLDFGKEGVVIAQTLNVFPDPPADGASQAIPTECSQAKELSLKIERDKGEDASDPIEIRVIEEPNPDNLAALPKGVSEVPTGQQDLTSPASGEPKKVVGGVSFSDALEVTPGTYSTEVVPGEKAFFKTRLEYGQAGLFSQDNLRLSDAVRAGLKPMDDIPVFSDVYGPDLSHISSQSGLNRYYQKSDGLLEASYPRILVTPEIRYRNRWDSPEMNGDALGYSMDGYYYYAVGLTGDELLKGQAATIDFSIAAQGEAANQPTSSVTPTTNLPSSSASAAPTSEGTTGGGFDGKLALIIGGGIVVAGGTVGAIIGLRRRLG